MNKGELIVKINALLNSKKLKTKNIWGNNIFQVDTIGDNQFCISNLKGFWEVSYCERGVARLKYRSNQVEEAIATLLSLIEQV